MPKLRIFALFALLAILAEMGLATEPAIVDVPSERTEASVERASEELGQPVAASSEVEEASTSLNEEKATPVEWVWYENVSQAWGLAKESERPLLVYVSSPSCLYCRKMEKDTLENQAVLEDLKASCVAVNVNARKDPKMAQHFRVRTYPTTLLIGPDGKLKTSVRGYMAPAAFRGKIRDALSN